MPSIQGQVVEYYSRRPVRGAVVQAAGKTATTGSSGMFSMELPRGVFTMMVTHRDFYDFVTSLNVTAPKAYDLGVITMQSKVRAL